MNYFDDSISLINNPTEDFCIDMIYRVISDNGLTLGNKYFIYSQFSGKLFRGLIPNTFNINDALDELYEHIVVGYKNSLHYEFSYIPKIERNNNYIVVLTGQLLGINHAPTKALFDRCKVLQDMGKIVMIINTAEICLVNHAVPWVEAWIGNYFDEYSRYENFRYGDHIFPFIQLPQIMPDKDVIMDILQTIVSSKPEMVISIGPSSIVADLCSNILPVLTIGTGVNRSMTRTTFQTICKEVSDDDIKWACKHGKTQNHFVKSIFTFSFDKKVQKKSKAEFNLPEDRFIAVVVGNRLDDEMDKDFHSMLKDLMNKKVFILFIGIYEKYENEIAKDKVYKDNSAYLGHQKNLMSAIGLGDCYINPHRLGGGTSAVMALYQGMPVVTEDYGDVAGNVGEEFCVSDYEEMQERVMLLLNNIDYRNQQSESALKRAELLTDTDGEFKRILSVTNERIIQMESDFYK